MPTASSHPQKSSAQSIIPMLWYVVSTTLREPTVIVARRTRRMKLRLGGATASRCFVGAARGGLG